MAASEPQRLAFTKTSVAKLSLPPAGRDRHYFKDTRTAGLVCCVTTSGARTFYLYKKVRGRPVRIRLGKFPETTVEQAGKMARKKIGDIENGIDPQADRRKARAESTLTDLYSHWIERAKARKRSWPEDERQYNKFLKPWRNRRLSAIERADVQALHSRVGRENGPYTANRLLALLSAMFGKAPDMGWNGANPCKGIERFPETERDRFLQAAELAPFFKALAGEQSEVMRDFFVLALFTGQRRRAVQAMAWADVNFDGPTWRVPESRSKNGEPIYVPLDEAALVILRRALSQKRGRGYCQVQSIQRHTYASLNTLGNGFVSGLV